MALVGAALTRAVQKRQNRANGLCWCGRPPVHGYKACEVCRGVQERRRERRRAAKCCTSCGRPAEANKTKCSVCLSESRDAHAAYRLAALEAYGTSCKHCGIDTLQFLTIDHIADDGAEHRKLIGSSSSALYRWLASQNYPEGFQTLCWNCNALKCQGALRTTAYSAYSQRIRLDAIKAYGGKCACCPVDDPAILVIDHVNGGGVAHRRELKRAGSKFCLWLRQHGYPSGYRVLCHNCNNALAAYGRCPHTTIGG